MSETKTKHSEGPWKVYPAGSSVPGYDVADRIVSDKYNGRVSHGPVREADLALMAAAPDLLDVARMAEQVADLSLLADDEWNAECSAIISRFRAAARAALAKAGVTP